MFSENTNSKAEGPPISCWTRTSVSYMLWLKARSFLALGMTTATRKGPAGAAVGASVAGGSVGAEVPQALNTSARDTINENNQANFFIFFSLI